jgi:hypothetical protein
MINTTRYMILLTNSDRNVQILGGNGGRPFNQRSAQFWAKRYEDAYPELQVLVLPVTALSIEATPIRGRREIN